MNIWKRSMALILCLCLMTSLLVPVVSAAEALQGTKTGGAAANTTDPVPGSKEEPYKVVYDYCYDGIFTSKTSLSGSAGKSALQSAYEAGTVNTNYYAHFSETGAAPYTMQFASDDGVYLGGSVTETTVIRPWMAFEVAELYAGSYTVELEYKVTSNGTRALEVYMIPVSAVNAVDTSAIADADGDGAVNTVDVIESLIAKDSDGNNAYLAGSKSSRNSSKSEYITEVVSMDFKITSAEKHIMVFRADKSASSTKTQAWMMVRSAIFTFNYPYVTPALSESTYTYDFSPEGFADEAKVYAQTNMDIMENRYLNYESNWSPYTINVAGTQPTIYCVEGEGTKWNFNGIWCNTFVGEWMAYKMVSPGDGNYVLSLTHRMNTSSARKGSLYILPLSLVDSAEDPKAAIDGALSDDTYLVGSTSFKGSGSAYSTVSIMGDYAFRSGEQYVMVFKAITSKSSSSDQAQMCLQELTAIKKTYTDSVYNFVEENYVGLSSSAIVDGEGNTVHSLISTNYAKAGTNWKIEGASDEGASFTSSGIAYAAQEGSWLAVRVRLPEPGTYTFTLKHPVSSKGADSAQVYVLQAGKATMAADEIEDALTPAALIGSATFNGTSGGNVTSNLGIYVCQSTCEEFVLVFHATYGSPEGAEIYLNEISIEKKNVVSWDFDMADSNSGFSGWHTKKMSDMKEQADAYFADGTLNWYVYGAKNTRSAFSEDALSGADFQKAYGMRMQTNLDDWYAFGLRSPGAGTYTLTLNHATYKYNTAECAVYIIEKPAAGTDMDALVKKLARDEDPVGYANMYTGTGYKDGSTTVLGTYDFKAGKEYVVIFYAMSPRSGSTSGSGYMILSQLFAVEGVVQGAATKNVSTINLGNPVNTLSMRAYAATVEVDGVDYYYVPIQGGQLLVYNLDTMTKVAEATSGINNVWGIDVTSDGTVYLCGDARWIFRYNVITGEQKRLYYSESSATVGSMRAQENGDFYTGCTSGGPRVLKYTAATDSFTYYGDLDPTGVANEVSGVAYKDGYIYAHIKGSVKDGSGTTTAEVTEIVKIDETTGEVVKRIDVAKYLEKRSEDYSRSAYYTRLNIVGDMLICGATYLNYFSCFDTDTLDYIDLGLVMGCNGEVSEVRDGKAYCTLYKGALVEIDVENRTASYVQGMSSVSTPMRINKNAFVTINHNSLPGESLMTFSTTYKGAPVFYNLETKKTVIYEDLTDGEGSSVTLRSLAASNDGSGMVYVGAFAVAACAGYNVNQEKYTYNFKTMSQTDSLLMYNGRLYAGCYPNCELAEVNPTSGTSVSLTGLKEDYSYYPQKRVHCLAAGDGMMFFSTVPDTDMCGGALVIYRFEDNDTTVLENFVDGQIILSMFYKDGLLYGCTSTAGGMNASPVKDVAVMFVYDVKNKVKLGDFVVKIDGVSTTDVPFIQAVGLNEADGTMWGAIANTLFTFTYDRKTNTMSFTEQLSFSKTKFDSSASRDWFGVPMIFKDGYLYYSFGGSGLYRIELSDMSYTNLVPGAPRAYAIAEDGNLYYMGSKSLMMLPLVYTDADWAAAGKVDAMILALDTKVTNANASKVQAALNAYDALSNVQKCLVQNKSILDTCQRRMVVNMIDALPANPTDADRAQIEATRAAYDLVTTLQKRFVENFDTLLAAESAIRYLDYLDQSEEAAALVMQHIENIPAEITMAAAGKITVARNGYDALTDYQKTLVTNYQKLLDAEAALQVLVTAQNQTYADKVIAQIDALGTITLRSQKAIMMARLAYGALTEEQKALVTNYQKLLDAEAELENLQKNGDANIKAVEAVEALIKLIGDEISLDSGDAIKAARKAYDALTDFQKTLVNNIDDLVEAEKLYGELKAEQDQMILIIAIIVVVVVIGAGVATVMIIPATRSKILGLFKKKEAKAEAESEAEAEAE